MFKKFFKAREIKEIMMKRGNILFLYTILFISALLISSALASAVVKAEYENNISLAYQWLENKTSDQNWPRTRTTEQLAFSLLALKDQISESSKQIAITNLTKKSYLGKGECWSMMPCSIKETALAKLALNAAGNSTDKADEWLINKSMAYIPSAGNWQLEIITEPGQKLRCALYYDNSQTPQGRLNVTKDAITGNYGACFAVADKYWLELAQ